MKRISRSKWVLFCILLLMPSSLLSEEMRKASKPYNLAKAFMCEGIKDRQPVNPAVIFSVSRGKAYCYSEFDAVQEKTVIIHHWIRRDATVTKIRLAIEPPRWGTYSSISLRETDRGPWRVEITDTEGNILKILRFSITE